MSDRHPKWQRVEPGTVIPAGQPYRIEYQSPGLTAGEYVPTRPETVDGRYGGWFVDSSWKPPLVLPNEPTWGIAVNALVPRQRLGRWSIRGDCFSDHRSWWSPIPVEQVTDFIPLTDEQVARIEAAR